MNGIDEWTGREARALRLARRMSIRQFARHLGVSDRMISKWEAAGVLVRPREVNQSGLDESLRRCTEDQRQRFLSFTETNAEPPRQVSVHWALILDLTNADADAPNRIIAAARAVLREPGAEAKQTA